jgi:hypothetical protein
LCGILKNGTFLNFPLKVGAMPLFENILYYGNLASKVFPHYFLCDGNMGSFDRDDDVLQLICYVLLLQNKIALSIFFAGASSREIGDDV